MNEPYYPMSEEDMYRILDDTEVMTRNLADHFYNRYPRTTKILDDFAALLHLLQGYLESERYTDNLDEVAKLMAHLRFN